MRYIFIFLFLTCVNILFAQEVKVLSTTEISSDFHTKAQFPKFSADDESIVYSTENYNGLYKYELSSKNSTTITYADGAGYNPIILDDETILYRTTKYQKGKKFHSLFSKDLKSNNETEIVGEQRNLKLPSQNSVSKILYKVDNRIESRSFEASKLAKQQEARAVYVENDDLILAEEVSVKLLNPLGKGVYVWESFSPDGNNVMFTFGSQGSFICDLDGNVLYHIDGAHYPKFSPDGRFVSYMVDADDGYNYVSSDIYVYSLNSKKSFQITKTDDQIEMFAEWSNDGKKLVFHTTAGKIIISTLEFEN